ncbi:DUF3994 domain-containing protein [Bacillus mycoides]|nr:DUF3994 domain-containing protein [Bacillus mycoides]
MMYESEKTNRCYSPSFDVTKWFCTVKEPAIKEAKTEESSLAKTTVKLRETFNEVEKVFKDKGSSTETDKAIIDKANDKLKDAKVYWKPVFDKVHAEVGGVK